MKKQLITLVIVVIVATIFYLITGRFQTQNIVIPCTQEARICPDGTTIRRVGPNCLFPACPINTQPTPAICGGIKGLTCPGDYTCLYENKVPDATGVCVKVDHPSPTTPSGYSCPTTDYVDCMPNPGMKNPVCNPQFLLWARDNCPNFKGAAY